MVACGVDNGDRPHYPLQDCCGGGQGHSGPAREQIGISRSQLVNALNGPVSVVTVGERQAKAQQPVK